MSSASADTKAVPAWEQKIKNGYWPETVAREFEPLLLPLFAKWVTANGFDRSDFQGLSCDDGFSLGASFEAFSIKMDTPIVRSVAAFLKVHADDAMSPYYGIIEDADEHWSEFTAE